MMTVSMAMMMMTVMTSLIGQLWWSNLWLPPAFYLLPYKVYLLHCDTAFEQDLKTILDEVHSREPLIQSSFQLASANLYLQTTVSSNGQAGNLQSTNTNEGAIRRRDWHASRIVCLTLVDKPRLCRRRGTTRPQLTAVSGVGHVLQRRRRGRSMGIHMSF